LRGLRDTSILTDRDVRLIRLDRKNVLVVGCDSAGAIGLKPLDRIKCSPYTVGRFTARVALMEILAVGAVPICIAAPLAVEPTPTGRSIIRGIRSEMEYAGLDPHTPLLDSTEKNFKVRQTGAGVTVIGLARAESLKVGLCEKGDVVFALGFPHVGTELLTTEQRHTVADTRDVRNLAESTSIHAVIPVGSRGMLHEANVIARESKLRFKCDKDVEIDLTRSAGPSTVILFASSRSLHIQTQILKPVNRIGMLTDFARLHQESLSDP
jgi:hypothetical protein